MITQWVDASFFSFIHAWVLQRAFIQEEATPSAAPADAAQLAILRLTYEEMSFRAVAVAGNWDSVSASAIQQAPLVKQQYPFSIFETQGQQQWVMMPAWSAVMVAAEPVALVIDDCAKLDVLMKQLQVPIATELHKQYAVLCTVKTSDASAVCSASKLLDMMYPLHC